MDNTNNLKFVSPKSCVDSNFWFKFADIKLYCDKLKDSPKNVYGYIDASIRNRLLIKVDCTGFNDKPAESFPCSGILLNRNTIEEFKQTDKTQLIKQLSDEYFRKLLTKDRLEDCAEIFFFLLLSFADFKAHKYYYWFAFPTLRDVMYKLMEDPNEITSILQPEEILTLSRCLGSSDKNRVEPFFVYDTAEKTTYRINDLIDHRHKEDNFRNADLNSIFFCCIDQSINNQPSWLLRQCLGYLAMTCPQLLNKKIKCICLHDTLEASYVYSIMMPSDEIHIDEASWVGWEANDEGKLVPRLANMSTIMDPLILAEKSINLNLALMKWRLLPDLDLDVIKQTKFLLLGSGTLGCGVARSLLAWGAQHITFVDNGVVSLSNPVRQSLFMYEDTIHGGKPKASTAAMRLKQIHPTVVSTGHCIQIPMPGHSVGPSQREEVNSSLQQLDNLVQNHDVVYLLTDSRESRWLPTMLAAYYGKMAITAALGFDSFLVLRHGSKTSPSVESKKFDGFKEVCGSHLGCYFCNDVTAPGNSLHDRTLDQQCTVTRPAVSNMASSLAVELTIALLQNDLRNSTPAYYRTTKGNDGPGDIPEDILGIVPHSIRGRIDVFDFLITATERFSECIACSKQVLDEFAEHGSSFIFEVLNSPKYLESIAGISKLTSIADEVIDFDSDDD